MPWREPQTAPFTRIGIVSHVPPESGVFGICEGELYIYIGSTWNLRGRLLELANLVDRPDGLSIVWEICPEPDCAVRRGTLEKELTSESLEDPGHRLPGIHLRPEPIRDSI